MGGERKGTRVLLVEDDALIAMDLEDSLQQAGAACVDVAATYDEASGFMAKRSYDVAIFDLHLDGVSAMPLIKQRVSDGGRCVVTSGDDSDGDVLSSLGVTLLMKPVSRNAVRGLLEG